MNFEDINMDIIDEHLNLVKKVPVSNFNKEERVSELQSNCISLFGTQFCKGLAHVSHSDIISFTDMSSYSLYYKYSEELKQLDPDSFKNMRKFLISSYRGRSHTK